MRRKIHESVSVAVFTEQEPIKGTDYEKIIVQQGRSEVSFHVNSQQLRKLADKLQDIADAMQMGREMNGATDTPDK